MLDGRLRIAGTQHDLGAGWLGSLSGSYAILDGHGSLPFLVASLSLGASGAPTKQIQPVEQAGDTLTAIDARIGVAFGKTLWRTLGPYVAARAFGGPVSWKFRGEDTTGTDDYHVQLGAGLVATTPVGLDVFAEIVPLGERAVTAGAGWSW